ncbi:TPA: fimbrial protein [Salmonella enterica]|uniref:Fimbrial protein n=1 Tax=Salmonella enterica TaxID=28901 RepID=A0A748KMT6_SALER|nr:fimbrial protein [Salmonella enterica]HAF5149069.1 fimbrial protein [Salmonella enterica]
MKRNKSVLTAPLLGLILPLASHGAAAPTEINVDFTATVIETTCNFIIDTAVSPAVKENTRNSQYTLTIPNVSLDKIISEDPAAQSNFTLKTDNCNPGISAISTKITSSAGRTGNLINNSLSNSTAATNIGMGFKRQSDSGNNFITPDNATTITWSSDERSAGLPLTVALRIVNGSGTTSTGEFESTATFNFTYN